MIRLVLLIALVFGGTCPVALAAPLPARGASKDIPCLRCGLASALPIAAGWRFSGSGGRTRVVQFCGLAMFIALVIMMRKLR